MLPDDYDWAARKSAAILDDPRVLHFYDPDQSSGNAIADGLGWPGHTAWDIYLFYQAGLEWIGAPPLPRYWMHQLKDDWADPEHFRTGHELVKELFICMEKIF